jgi:hypothetical protein
MSSLFRDRSCGSNCSCRGHRPSAEVVVRPPTEAVVRLPNEGAPVRRARGTSAAATCQGPLRHLPPWPRPHSHKLETRPESASGQKGTLPSPIHTS